MSDTRITTISDAELDAVGAGFFDTTVVGIFIARQSNSARQSSVNILSAGSGNQAISQTNIANVSS